MGSNSNCSKNINQTICDPNSDLSVMETNNCTLETDGRESLLDTSYMTEEIKDALFEVGYSMEEIKDIVAARSSELETLNSDKNSEKIDVILTDELHEEDTNFEDRDENANNFIRKIKIKM